MVRIIGVNIPEDKKVLYALTLLYGIGWSTSRTIIKKANISANEKINQLSEAELKKLQDIIEGYKIEGAMKEVIGANIKRLKEIGSYRGLRHIRGLPVRGQRTKSNARTKRGKRKTVGALRKEEHSRLEQQQQQSARK